MRTFRMPVKIKYTCGLFLCIGVMGFALSCFNPEPHTDRPVQVDPTSTKSHTALTGEVQSQPHIRLTIASAQSSYGVIEVTELSRGFLQNLKKLELTDQHWRTLMPVFTGQTFPREREIKPAMLGKYEILSDGIRFIPRFPFEPGMAYCARLNFNYMNQLNKENDQEEAGEFIETYFEIPDVEIVSTTFVEHVYPSSNELPENLLRLYIHFSAPMGNDNVHDYIRLLNSRNEEVPLPFVEIKEGLWDTSRCRLTLFFHPGRIKRGVGPNLKMGSVLQKGKTYRIVINQRLRDAAGQPLMKSFEKKFKVVTADRKSPDIQKWNLDVPHVSSFEPLTLAFHEPLDHALLGRFLAVKDPAGREISGTINISKHETRWAFTPDRSWVPGNYKILVNPALEDLAGNRLNRLFDENLRSQAKETLVDDLITLDFEVMQKLR